MIERGLEPVLRELKVRKVTQVFVNGSFVTANPTLRTSTLMYWSLVERVLYSGGLVIVQGNGEKYMALSVSPLSKEPLAQDRRLIGKSCSAIKTARQKASSS